MFAILRALAVIALWALALYLALIQPIRSYRRFQRSQRFGVFQWRTRRSLVFDLLQWEWLALTFACVGGASLVAPAPLASIVLLEGAFFSLGIGSFFSNLQTYEETKSQSRESAKGTLILGSLIVFVPLALQGIAVAAVAVLRLVCGC
ncbi:MAG: hypothetical protein IVW51_19200 [Thermaceae bacterium]|nr:hypothetical protein [Thermaceae bacterium]